MSREQLVNSEQTAALQETLSMSSQPSLSSPQTHKGDLASVLLSPLFFAVFVSPGWLLGLDLVNRINLAQKAS